MRKIILNHSLLCLVEEKLQVSKLKAESILAEFKKLAIWTAEQSGRYSLRGLPLQENQFRMGVNLATLGLCWVSGYVAAAMVPSTILRICCDKNAGGIHCGPQHHQTASRFSIRLST